MKRNSMLIVVGVLLVTATPAARAGLIEDLSRELAPLVGESPTLDDATVVKGLKEALATGTERAVREVAKPDGYFGNQLIKILLPDKIRKVGDLLGTLGFQSQVDEFVLSMNRAAEKAAPQAAGLFADAVRQMSFADARKILAGGDTAATDYFREKTSAKLYGAFEPVVAKSMSEVGTTRAYQEMIGKYESLPFAGAQSLDLNRYVTNKALDGLFTMLGAEEKNIRTNPAARTTDLLRKVFGK